MVWESTDAGATFTELTIRGPQPDWTACYDVCVCETNSSIMYACGETTPTGGSGYDPLIWGSTDAGATWTDVTGDLASYCNPGYAWMTAMWMSPEDSQVVFTSGYGIANCGLLYTTDGGTTWNECLAIPSSGSDFAYDAAAGRLYFASNGGGVFYTDDMGVNWTDISAGLGSLNVRDIEIDTLNGWLIVGSSGGGVSRYDITPNALWCGQNEAPGATGDTIDFALNAGAAYAGRTYIVAGSATGTSPGTMVGSVTVPLNRDNLTNFILANLGKPMFKGFYGKLDGSGMATATFNVPPVPGLAGSGFHFAYCTLGPADFASNAVPVYITP